MSTSIYYFSGTGNSLHTARVVAKQLDRECKITNMAKPIDQQAVEGKYDTIGFVFPVYYLDMPTIVRDYVKKLKLNPEAYIFSIATCGGESGATFHELDKLLKDKGGRLSAGLTIIMPDNAYIGVNLITPVEKREQVLKATDAKLAKFIEALKKKEIVTSKGGALSGRILGSLSSTFASKLYRLPRQYHSTDRCNNCGTCVKICPTNNVTLETDNKKVTWGSNCAHCQACFHWCPKQAVEIGKKSAGIARYHHPEISLKDILLK
ncbi:MAG TPA: EFR1 family ferrodoxin [Methanocella sp.]|nr:EFR1 family ferrodoxin [Methanocella sp.]